MPDPIGEAVAVMLMGTFVVFVLWLLVGVAMYLYYGIEEELRKSLGPDNLVDHYRVVDSMPYKETRQMGRRVVTIGTALGQIAVVLAALCGVGQLFLLAVSAA